MNPMSMSGTFPTVAVTGSTGFVGRHVVRELVARGHPVRALARGRDRVAEAFGLLDGGKVEYVFGDVFDAAAMRDLMHGASAVVHAIGIRREFPPEVTFERMHPRATEAAVRAAEHARARRFIHISAMGTRPGAPSAYHRSKHESEAIVRESGLEWTILRPSIIHGPDGEFMKMAKSWAMGRSAPFFFMPYFTRMEKPQGFGPPKFVSAKVQPVSVGDVAFAAVEAIHREEAVGEIYPLGGPDVIDWPTMLATVRDAIPLADHHKKIRGIPGDAARVKAVIASKIGLAAALPFGPSEPVMAMEDNVCSNEKARADLGFEPSDFVTSVKSYGERI
ncbi:MAG TPA: NAD(P)H-binding protein [Phycisphaerales bacterium]|nr:NAD(P)H-binding protein [Phycisphaerales bacterium]